MTPGLMFVVTDVVTGRVLVRRLVVVSDDVEALADADAATATAYASATGHAVRLAYVDPDGLLPGGDVLEVRP